MSEATGRGILAVETRASAREACPPRTVFAVLSSLFRPPSLRLCVERDFWQLRRESERQHQDHDRGLQEMRNIIFRSRPSEMEQLC